MESNIFLGIFLHAIGGIAAATCFVPQKGTPRWSYQSFWLMMVFFAWFVMPIAVAWITVPDLWMVISQTETQILLIVTALGAAYGFGGMAFGMAIRHIGFSLTYAIAIGISAVLGTVIPGLIAGTLMESIAKPGGSLLVAGFAASIVGIFFCGLAGAHKEKELKLSDSSESSFDLKKGLVLVVIAGVLSAVFSVGLSMGEPITKLAAAHGAGDYQSGAVYIFAMGGAFLTNLIWWGIVHTRQKTWGEYIKLPATSKGKSSLPIHYIFGITAGVLWYVQFLFYGLGHVNMGEFKFISWGIHMAMLIFFSFGIGLILKEWKGLSSKTISVLLLGLVILLGSFGLITYAGYVGEQAAQTSETQPVSESSGH